ncbi:MAG TPA: hypothetical protein VJZ71_02185 [Phycisphaerae bacterium]|nr:hypothetical protein [Phycisphaerae bacterium]
MSLGQFPQDSRAEGGSTASETTTETTVETKSEICDIYGYKEVSDFFNIREANPQVSACEWEFELGADWATRSDGEDDEFGLEQTIKYGITDDIFVELEVQEPSLGDGGDQGTGDLNLILFERVLKETECLPAIGLQQEMRIPSGDGSSGVDGRFHLVLTKHIIDKLRVHLDGYIETANGSQGASDEDEDRRHFQWGVGPGFDYEIDEQTLVLINYLNRSSEEYGHHNQNILELGAVREIARTECTAQHVKIAADIGLDGQEETPNFGAKLMWSIDWK